MIMDRGLEGYHGSGSGSAFNEESVLNRGRFVEQALVDSNSISRPMPLSSSHPSSFDPPISVSTQGDLHEDYDFSDVVLKYINRMLMEEGIEEKSCMFQESAALQAAEKSFYDVLVVKNPSSPRNDASPSLYLNSEYPDENPTEDDSCWLGCEISDYGSYPHFKSPAVNPESQSISQSSCSSSNSSGNITDGLVDSAMSNLSVCDMLIDNHSVMHYKKGFEEASTFLPDGIGFLDDLGNGSLLSKELKKETSNLVIKLEKKNEFPSFPDVSRGKKNPYSEATMLEGGRSNKHSAIFTESTVRSGLFDKVLLCSGEKVESSAPCESLRVAAKCHRQKSQSKGTNGGKTRTKRQSGAKDVVDLRTLLTLCAQSVALNDHRSVADLLNQIRQHSSPVGDGMQRIAHYFSAGLEARMAGSGTEIYKALISLPASAADILKAYHLYIDFCPFRKISNFFSNKTIMYAAEKATRLHIIDFGILWGFQWPCLMQRLSCRPGGPPKLRITGIDFPCPGFRPSERVEETGSRLANYAETFGVPFEFIAIAQKWETIKIEDLKLENDELLVVNCAYRMKNLLDETVVVESPRNAVLNLIREMNPAVFIQGIINGSYNAPFFITRFREALFFFSSLFDMLEDNVPREVPERMLIEKIIWGREAMNVISCEGGERIERPETYKQWQVRNLRAGFRQLPLNREILSMAKDKAKSCYQKNFTVDEDGQWLLQGWKGRIIYAISSWRPAY